MTDIDNQYFALLDLHPSHSASIRMTEICSLNFQFVHYCIDL
jgi:hypothetical protein